MKTRIWMPLLAVAALAATATIATAFPPGRGPGRGPGYGPGACGGPGFGPGYGMVRALDLTDAQKQQLETLREEHHKVMEPLWERMEELHGKLDEMLEAEGTSAAELGQQMIAVRDVRKQMEAAWEAHDAKLEAMLTPEQQQKWKELKEERPRRGGPGFRRWHHGPADL